MEDTLRPHPQHLTISLTDSGDSMRHYRYYALILLDLRSNRAKSSESMRRVKLTGDTSRPSSYRNAEEDSSAVNVLLSKCQRPYFVVCGSFQIARVPVTTVIPEELIKLLIKMVPASVEGLRSMQDSL